MPGIQRVAFTVFGFPVYWYGALIALGMLLGVLLASRREARYGQKRDTVVNFVLIAIPVALVCARIYYVAFSWKDYAAHPLEIFNVRNGGLAIYGGVIGGVITGVLYSRRARVSFGTLADLCAPALALGQAIGRWGNFFNQEAYGAPVHREWMRFFPMAVYIQDIDQWRYAAFFYESIWCFLIVAGLLWAERKKCFRRPGDVFLWYVLAYSAERMVVEGLRADSLYLGPIRISQLLSAAALAAVMILFLVRAYRSGAKQLSPAVAIALFLALLPLVFLWCPVWLQAVYALVLLALGARAYQLPEDR